MDCGDFKSEKDGKHLVNKSLIMLALTPRQG